LLPHGSSTRGPIEGRSNNVEISHSSLDAQRRYTRCFKGTGLRAAVSKFAESAGGKLDAYYFAFGQHDVVAIVDFPDNVSAAAVSVAANGAGMVDLAMTPLITPEEMDQAVEKSRTLTVPGQG
jgi:uncharacterized protein with GYD domain